MDQDPLLLVLFELRKAYDTVDRGCLQGTLDGYGVRPRIFRLLAVFWDQKEVFTRQNGYRGPNFNANMGTTQVGLILPTLFSLIVDNVVRNWLVMMLEDQLVAHKGLGLEVGGCMGLFYADNGVAR